jgi:hypothetical protein
VGTSIRPRLSARKSDNITTIVAIDTRDIGWNRPSTWMNPSAVKLFFALVWLVPGVGFLTHDLLTGHTLSMPFGQLRIPFAVPCLILATFNFLRWWAGRPRDKSAPFTVRTRRVRPDSEPEAPNPAFKFDEPDAPAGRET